MSIRWQAPYTTYINSPCLTHTFNKHSTRQIHTGYNSSSPIIEAIGKIHTDTFDIQYHMLVNLAHKYTMLIVNVYCC